MQLLNLRTRAVYQNTPAASCQELAGICVEDAIILICIIVFVVGLSLLTLCLNLRARLRLPRQREDRAPSPPPYSSLGFLPSSSRVSLCKTESDPKSPPLDPYRVVVPSLNGSVLLKDDYFSHVPHPDRTLAPSRPAPSPPLPADVGLGFGSSVHTGPATFLIPSDVSLTPPSPAYVQDMRRTEDSVIL